MPRTGPDVTAAELSVLKSLWDDGGSTIRELTDRLYPGGNVSHYATVQKLLERLEAKGCVRREKRVRPQRFEATVDRDTLIDHRLRETADRLCDGSIAPLLTQLVTGEHRLTDDELDSLRALVDRAGRRRR